MDGVTAALARFYAETSYAAIPAEAVHEAKRAILDGLGVGLGGADHPSADILLQYARRVGERPEAQVWGRPERLPAELAALVNGHQEHVLDFDDTFLPEETVLHGTVPVLPAAFAVAEARQLSGRALLRAFVLGFDAEARLAMALGRQHYLAGWHVTATVGPVGSAVAVGTMIGLRPDQLVHAVGIALTHSGGVTAMLGSMSKAYHCGKAAEAGVRAALLAEAGFDSASEPLTHPQGYLNVAASDRAVHRLTDQLGERWLLLENGYKPYASGVVTHPIIDAMVAFRAEGVRPETVARVEAFVNPFVLQVTGQREPQSGLEGKFSAYHCAAVGLIDGAAGKQQFTDERVRDPAVVALRRRVVLTPDHSLRKDECRVVLHLQDGTTRERAIPRASGTADNPLSDEALSAKFLALAAPVLGGRAAQLLDHVWTLEQVSNVADLAPLLRP
ncbi:MAG: MmgE/PrpD family protein [Chloroflexota bacterium]|nr:MmgE/PrpD family protein [Dehalococcoidia bacterium]MDW8254001.1 MmgE/PrpD family protein [Chloroflexota bacterium]